MREDEGQHWFLRHCKEDEEKRKKTLRKSVGEGISDGHEEWGHTGIENGQFE